jgi:hypothetical protein
MTPEIVVERHFHFYCSCGATTLTGERTVTCSGCGRTLGIRRVRRHRQHRGAVAYYGEAINSRMLKVRRVEKHSAPRLEAQSRLREIRHERRMPHGIGILLASLFGAAAIVAVYYLGRFFSN